MKIRAFIFTALVVLILAANLALVSLRVAQTGEDTARGRIALAVAALRAQLELLDARLNPRAAAASPELIDAMRSAAESGPASSALQNLPPQRPDPRALRAATAAMQPEPELLAVVNAQGAMLARKGRPPQTLEDPALLPFARSALEGASGPVFAEYDGATFRFAAARIPGTPAAVVTGSPVDDHLATQLRSQVDADVTILHGTAIVASSLAQGEERARLGRWAAQPSQGFGTLPVRLPLIGYALTGRLPVGASKVAMRGALIPLEGGLHAAITVPASPYLSWLARYQAFYAAGLVVFVLFSLVWFLLPRAAPAAAVAPRPQPAPRKPTPAAAAPVPSLVGTDVSEARAEPKPKPRDVPWSPGEGPSGELPIPLSARPPAPPPVTAPLLGSARTRGEEEGGTTIAPSVEEVEEVEETEEVSAAAGDPWAPPPAVPLPSPASPAAAAEPGDDWGAAAAPSSSGAADGWDTFAPPPAADDDWAMASAPPPAPVETPAPPPAPAKRTATPAPEAKAPAPAEAKTPAPPGTPAPTPAKAEAAAAPAIVPPAAAIVPPAPAAGGAFTFEGLLDDGQAKGARSPERHGEETARLFGGAAGAGAEAQEAQEAFPGDEPTRVEPVSAALLDKLREKDEELARAAQEAVRSLEAAEEKQAAPQPAPSAPEHAAEEEGDPDLPHWRETFEKFLALKQELGESAGALSFEKFSAKLRKNREDLLAKHQARGVRFVVYEKDGKAAIKASAIR